MSNAGTESSSKSSRSSLKSRSHLSTEKRWYRIKSFLYNKEKNTFCSRTKTHWLYSFLFFLAFTSIMLSLFASGVFGITSFFKDNYKDSPKFDKSTLKIFSPGLSFIPNIIRTTAPIIWYSFDKDEKKQTGHYIKQLNKDFKKYRDASRNLGEYRNCTGSTEKAQKKPCFFDIKNLDECVSGNYEYTKHSMCFFLRLNRLKNWTPKYYSKPPGNFPDRLAEKLKATKKQVWVECNGERFWDSQHLGEVKYFPDQGFPGYYFPYLGQKNYLPPLVGVKLDNLTAGVVIFVKCRVWADNIKEELANMFLKIYVDNIVND